MCKPTISILLFCLTWLSPVVCFPTAAAYCCSKTRRRWCSFQTAIPLWHSTQPTSTQLPAECRVKLPKLPRDKPPSFSRLPPRDPSITRVDPTWTWWWAWWWTEVVLKHLLWISRHTTVVAPPEAINRTASCPTWMTCPVRFDDWSPSMRSSVRWRAVWWVISR